MGQGRHTLRSISDPVYPAPRPIAKVINNSTLHYTIHAQRHGNTMSRLPTCNLCQLVQAALQSNLEQAVRTLI